MIYDKHTKLIEQMVLYLHELKPTDYVTYEQIANHLKVTKIELERVLKNFDYSFLFETECLCSRNKGASTEDMFLLSIEAERLINESNSWIGWIVKSYQKPLKLQAKYDRITQLATPTKIAIIAAYTVSVSIITFWLTFKQLSNDDRNKISVKTVQELTESNAKKDSIIIKLNKTLTEISKQ